MESSRYSAYSSALDILKSENRFRSIPSASPEDMIDMVSNDYLGLASDKVLLPFDWSDIPSNLKKIYYNLVNNSENSLMTSSASRLLSTRQGWFALLEELLANDYGRPALLFNSGYHANTGVIGALNIPGTHFLIDKLMHASAYDGLFAAKASFDRFPHNNIEKLAGIIEKRQKENKFQRFVVITESVFSMDGDIGALKELVELRSRIPDLIVYVDEAHGFGCFGNRGLGVCEEMDILDSIDIIIGTFGKAGASMGAFAITHPIIRDYMINSARSFIFSTALPPGVIRNSLENYLRIRGAADRRERLKKISLEVKKVITELFEPTATESQIIPLMTRSATKAISVSENLRRHGIMALPIRRPTVPPGAERVRLSLSATLPGNIADLLANCLSGLM